MVVFEGRQTCAETLQTLAGPRWLLSAGERGKSGQGSWHVVLRGCGLLSARLCSCLCIRPWDSILAASRSRETPRDCRLIFQSATPSTPALWMPLTPDRQPACTPLQSVCLPGWIPWPRGVGCCDPAESMQSLQQQAGGAGNSKLQVGLGEWGLSQLPSSRASPLQPPGKSAGAKKRHAPVAMDMQHRGPGHSRD